MIIQIIFQNRNSYTVDPFLIISSCSHHISSPISIQIGVLTTYALLTRPKYFWENEKNLHQVSRIGIFYVNQNYLMLCAANTNCFKFLFFFKYVSKEYYYFFQFAYNSLLLFGLTFPKMYIMMHSICKFESIILFLTTTA